MKLKTYMDGLSLLCVISPHLTAFVCYFSEDTLMLLHMSHMSAGVCFEGEICLTPLQWLHCHSSSPDLGQTWVKPTAPALTWVKPGSNLLPVSSANKVEERRDRRPCTPTSCPPVWPTVSLRQPSRLPVATHSQLWRRNPRDARK